MSIVKCIILFMPIWILCFLSIEDINANNYGNTLSSVMQVNMQQDKHPIGLDMLEASEMESETEMETVKPESYGSLYSIINQDCFWNNLICSFCQGGNTTFHSTKFRIHLLNILPFP